MPSRSQTWPFVLQPMASTGSLSEGALEGDFSWQTSGSGGLVYGNSAPKLARVVQRGHALSPLLSAENLLLSGMRKVPDAGPGVSAAVVCVAEQTLSVAALGHAAIWVLRAGQVMLYAKSDGARTQGEVQPARLHDVVCLAVSDDALNLDEVEAAFQHDGRIQNVATLRLLCSRADSDKTIRPIGPGAPNKTWVKTIFNEYGDHCSKES